jgi:hypothetical protein
MHQEIWPEVKIRKKLVGYEGAEGEPGTGPDFIGNFQRTFMDGVVNTKHVLSQDQVFDLLVE